MNRSIFIVFAMVLIGCASKNIHPDYHHAKNICMAEEQAYGMHRITPTSAQINAALPLLKLTNGEKVIYWFQDGHGSIEVGISRFENIYAGTEHRAVELVKNENVLSVKPGPEMMESICI